MNKPIKTSSSSSNAKGYSEQDDAFKVTSMQKRMRDDFILAGGLDASKWDSVIGKGMALTATNGLVITTGTTVNAESYILSKDVFTIPMRVSVGLTLSQRIINQGFYIELVSVNPVTLVPDGKNIAAWKFDGTSATSNQYRVTNSGATPADSAYITTTTTGGGGLFEIEVFTDEAWFHSNIVDSSNARSASFRKHLRIPDPNALYKLRIRALNSATAPALSTTMTVSYVAIDDYAEMTAEITAGRGQGSVGQSMGVQVLNAMSIASNQMITLNPQPAGGGFSTAGKLRSLASTNALTIKGSSAMLASMQGFNLAATNRFLKLYNKVSTPVPGTDTPIAIITLPPNQSFKVDIPAMGWRFPLGLGIAITGGISDSDVTAIGADEVVVNWVYA